MNRIVILALLSGLLAAAGCQREVAPAAGKAPAASPAPAAGSPAAAQKPAAAAGVARIVFLDQEQACACTKKRIEASWKAITDVLGFPPAIDVERIHVDTQKQQAAPYKAQKPVMVVPGIYFFDKQDKLLAMLQGEVTAAQLRKQVGQIR